MTTSQNGYKSRDSSLIATYTIARDIKISLRKGAVSVVLLHFARWYDQNIEPLTKADTGGYNPRVIEGSKVDSNHASGTAMDLRWNKHARGKKNTFTAGQKAKIEKQLAFYEGAIRWGELYSSAPVDGMHYEANKDETFFIKIAKKIKDSETPAKPSVPSAPAKPIWETDPLVVDGDLGPKTIKRWQVVVRHKTVTDKMDKDFIGAIQVFLKGRVDHRLVVDRVWGPKTTRALDRYIGSPPDGVMEERTIKALQRRLNTGHF